MVGIVVTCRRGETCGTAVWMTPGWLLLHGPPPPPPPRQQLEISEEWASLEAGRHSQPCPIHSSHWANQTMMTNGMAPAASRPPRQVADWSVHHVLSLPCNYQQDTLRQVEGETRGQHNDHSIEAKFKHEHLQVNTDQGPA